MLTADEFLDWLQPGSRALPGFWLERAWLNPEALPPVLECLEQVLAHG